ncbi:MAG TPA: FtsQ-type POTRA domain-containing protein [Candidatus Udaeobacter sp.]|jgi:cell division septal protein FtsQ|nr:FtsQ-type POTRA domain-containing protein [Candidatus Udaeobacter sp.]
MSFRQRTPGTRNRRLSNVRQRRQQHLLDVKVRSRRATQHRIRNAMGVFWKMALFVILCAGGVIGMREAAKRLFFQNPEYQIKAIELQTDGTLQREQVLKAADLHEGSNIFSINLAKVRDRIQQLPQADEVEIVRKLPSEIDIRVVERKPVAWITSETEITDPFASDGAFLVGARGVLMKQKKLLPEYLGLPLILGCSGESLEAGKTLESVEAKMALELLRLTESNFLQTRFQIREIDISKSYCLLVTDKNRSRVMFGLNDLEEQLRRLQVFLDYCDNTKQELATLNLVAQRNIPVTFTSPATDVINDTLSPAVEPRIMKAIPVHAPENRNHQDSSIKPNGASVPKSRAAALSNKAIRNQQKKAE